VLRQQPDWSARTRAQHLGRSLSWVKKWRRRLRAAAPDDDSVLADRSHARHQPPPASSPLVVERLLAIRDQPPAGLQRVPGPRTILYYLQQDPDLRASGVHLPRSTRTIWEILTRHGRIAHPARRQHEPLDRPPPLTSWQLDFKDVATVPAEPDGKRQHVVEALNCVDSGTSILIEAQVRADFTEETALEAVADLVRTHGLPQTLTFDRDPRSVGSPGGGDCPSPVLRCLACLGVEVVVCPPHRPDRNAFVERDNGTYERACLQGHRPATLEQAREVTAAFHYHYNHERPNQARSCGNRPPRVAFPVLPARPALPGRVDPDRWLGLLDRRRFVRKVHPNGTVLVEHDRYDVGRQLSGQYVVVSVEAGTRTLVVQHQQRVIKRLALKWERQDPLDFEAYLALMRQEARIRRRRVRRTNARAA
jgi:hypothetical protein